MKTLLITLEYPPMIGGVANYYFNLKEYWPDEDKMIILDNNDLGLVNHYFPLFKWLPSIFNTYKTIKRYKVKHLIVGQILPLGITAYIIKKITGLDYSIIIHGMDYAFTKKTKRKNNISKKILHNAKNIICSNSFVANMISKDEPSCLSKIIVANPGVSAPVETIDFSINDLVTDSKNKKIILSIGRLVKRKGIDNTIKAMEAVLKILPDTMYLIAGSGIDEEHLKDLAVGSDSIKFLGQISEAQKWFLLKKCDLFVMPSRNIEGDFEGFGIVYLEANLCGKAVIAGNEGGENDAVLNGFNGVLVDPKNIDQIADSIIKLLSDDNTRNTMGANGKKRAEEKFNWSDIIKKLYNEMNI